MNKKENNLKNQLEDTQGCLLMIKDYLEGAGIEMENCPPMFYPEAITKLVLKRLKEVGAIPGEVATHKWIETSKGKYEKIKLSDEYKKETNTS